MQGGVVDTSGGSFAVHADEEADLPLAERVGVAQERETRGSSRFAVDAAWLPAKVVSALMPSRPAVVPEGSESSNWRSGRASTNAATSERSQMSSAAEATGDVQSRAHIVLEAPTVANKEAWIRVLTGDMRRLGMPQASAVGPEGTVKGGHRGSVKSALRPLKAAPVFRPAASSGAPRSSEKVIVLTIASISALHCSACASSH